MKKTQFKTAHLIANPKSGKGKARDLPQIASGLAERYGVKLTHHQTGSGFDFEQQIKKCRDLAEQEDGVVIAAGGDGTIRSVAQQVVGHNVRFGAVPCGTFNFFARSHKLPEDPTDALELIFKGNFQPVRLGKLNEHYFLINASFGLYAKSIKNRENDTKLWGRDRLVVILSTMKSLLKPHRTMAIDMLKDGKTISLSSSSVFIGNNALQLENLAIDVAHCMTENKLAIMVLKPVNRLDMLRIFWRGLAKTLSDEQRLKTFCSDSLTIRFSKKKTMVAIDGEILHVGSPIQIEAIPHALTMAVPEVSV